jgi:hypothetical protein
MTGKANTENAESYQPTQREAEALAAFEKRCKSRKANARWKVAYNEESDSSQIAPDHVDIGTASNLLAESLGTASGDFAIGILNQISTLSCKDGKVSEEQLNFLLSVIEGVEPRNEVEAMLALQMGVVHMASMKASLFLSQATMLPQYDSAVKAITKLARTYTAQMETLKKFRSGGEQNVTVKHVHVHDGGQAIVGNIAAREGVASKLEGQPRAKPPAAISNAPQPEMRGALQTDRQSMPERRDG